jgi:hypothetical protein
MFVDTVTHYDWDYNEVEQDYDTGKEFDHIPK